jgi:hypothetical protein
VASIRRSRRNNGIWARARRSAVSSSPKRSPPVGRARFSRSSQRSIPSWFRRTTAAHSGSMGNRRR